MVDIGYGWKNDDGLSWLVMVNHDKDICESYGQLHLGALEHLDYFSLTGWEVQQIRVD